jgi:hypothetical protein
MPTGPAARIAAHGQCDRRQFRVHRNDKLFWQAYFPVSQSIKEIMSNKAARTLTFKCKKCSKPVTVYLQKVSACSHIQPYQGMCKCGELLRHATGQKDAVESFLASPDGNWSHHHHHH